MGMKRFASKCSDQLDDLIVGVRDTKGNKEATKKINTLIIIDVHARDIIDKFVRDSVLDEREFAWESQLRFSWDREADDVLIRQCTGLFQFGYEYQGLSSRLVITPLTDRCYMTLHAGAALPPRRRARRPRGHGQDGDGQGPGQGAGAAVQGLLLRRGPRLQGDGQHLRGPRADGRVGLLRRVQPHPVEVLSVVSAQIKTIQTALSEGLKRFTFEGREIASSTPSASSSR